MELHRIFIIFLFGVFLVVLTVIGIRNKKSKISSKGISPINNKLFLLAKFSMFIIWIMTVLQALNPGLIGIKFYNNLSWISVSVIFLGIIIIIIAYISLGI